MNLHAELSLAGQPIRSGDWPIRLPDSYVVEHDAPRTGFVVSADVRSPRSAVDHDRDAVQFFVTGVEDVPAHLTPAQN